MKWNSFLAMMLDGLALLCGLLFVLPLGLLLWGSFTGITWLLQRVQMIKRFLDARHTSIPNNREKQHERVTTMPVVYEPAPLNMPVSVGPEDHHTPAQPKDLAHWMRDLQAHSASYGVSFTQDQAVRLYLYQRGAASVPAPTESEAD